MASDDRQGTLKTVSPSRREIDLEIAWERVHQEMEKAVTAYAGRVKLAGFRQGKAPRDMVKRLYDEEIRHDVVEALVPEVLEEELRGTGVKPVSVPVIEDLHFHDDEPLRCRVTFEVFPDFDLPDYRRIEVADKPAAVGDEDVERALEELRGRAAEYVPVEGRGVAEGDYVVVEIQGRDLRSKRLLPVEKAVVLAGHAENDAALNENLVGLKPGAERSYKASYPKDHANRKVAGKDIEYRLKVLELKERRLPELNDEFARSLGSQAGLEDLKTRLRAELQAAKESSRRNAVAAEMLEEIGRRASIELPESLVKRESLAVLRRLVAAYPGAAASPQAAESLPAEARRQAERTLRNHLILNKLAVQEGLSVSDAEVDEEVRTMAKANNVPAPQLLERLRQEGRDEEIRENLLFRKAIDFLARHAIMK
jgi:trigger factor